MAHRQADRRRGAWRGRGCRRRAGGDGGFPRHLPGGAVLGEFHPAGLPSGVRPDRLAAAADRGAAGGAADVHRAADHRRAGTGDRPGRLLRAAGSGAGQGDRTRDRDRPVRAAGDRGHARDAAPRPGRGGGARRPSANTRSRTGCATPRTSAKASRRWPSGGCRTSRRVSPVPPCLDHRGWRRPTGRHCRTAPAPLAHARCMVLDAVEDRRTTASPADCSTHMSVSASRLRLFTNFFCQGTRLGAFSPPA